MSEPVANGVAEQGGERAADSGDGGQKKTKAQLKAERRALQEAQRAAKSAMKAASGGGGGAPAQSKGPQQQPSKPDQPAKGAKGKHDVIDAPPVAAPARKDSRGTEPASSAPLADTSHIHPAFKRLATDCLNGTLLDSHDVCEAMVDALSQFIGTLEPARAGGLSRELDAALRPQISYLTGGRALPAGCGTLVKQLKQQVHTGGERSALTDAQLRERLLAWLADFRHERLHLSVEAISQNARAKLGRRVLTYAWCPIVQRLLLDAHERDADLTVSVVDYMPEMPGKRLLSRLVEAGVPVIYSLLSSLSYTIKDASLVLLGCDSVAANGHVLARPGACQLALVARARNVPVLAVCPTYKFSEKVWTRAAGVDGSSFAPTGPAAGRQPPFSQPTASAGDNPLCTQRQELVPADLITGVVTELRLLPPSSAPAVLRVKQQTSA